MDSKDSEIRELIHRRRAVVVGVDGSAANAAAIQWGAFVAHDEGRLLVLVHMVDPALRNSPYMTIQEIRQTSYPIVDSAISQVREAYQDLETVAHQQFGRTASAMRDLSVGAELLVLGRHGRNGFARLLVGSVSCSLGNHAVVPVAVIPSGWNEADHSGGAVVVGIDGSPGSDEALGYALTQAERLACEVRVVNVWGPDYLMPAEQLMAYGGIELWKKEATELVMGTVATARKRSPGLRITAIATEGHPVAALSSESESARLLIVGGHDAGRVHATLVASTTNGVLHHASCRSLSFPNGCESGSPWAQAGTPLRSK